MDTIYTIFLFFALLITVSADAISDGFMHNGKKELSKYFQLLFVTGMLLLGHYHLLGWFEIAAFIFLWMPSHNIIVGSMMGNGWYYFGTTSLTDRVLRKLNPHKSIIGMAYFVLFLIAFGFVVSESQTIWNLMIKKLGL